MPAPKKYDVEFRERAMRMYRDRLAEGSDSKMGARRHVGALLDLNPATLRNWIEDEERRDGTRAPIATVRGLVLRQHRSLVLRGERPPLRTIRPDSCHVGVIPGRAGCLCWSAA